MTRMGAAAAAPPVFFTAKPYVIAVPALENVVGVGVTVSDRVVGGAGGPRKGEMVKPGMYDVVGATEKFIVASVFVPPASVTVLVTAQFWAGYELHKTTPGRVAMHPLPEQLGLWFA